MCSNIVFDYMDDMVESFEGFIQKSLLAIIVALGVIVGSVLYLLKILSERSLESSFGGQEARIGGRNYQNTISREGRVKPRRRDVVNEDFLVVQNDNTKVSAAAMAHSIPSYDESVLRLVGLSCCKSSCKSKSKTQGTDYDRGSKSSDINMAPIIKQEVEYEIQSRSPIPTMPQDIKLEKPSRSNSRSPLRSPSPKHSSASIKICPKASSRKSCCSLCCKIENPI